MDGTTTENDICINLGFHYKQFGFHYENTNQSEKIVTNNDSFDKDEIIYNVSESIRRGKWLQSAELNAFAKTLDAKVFIDPNSERYGHIYNGMNIIARRIVSKLSQKSQCVYRDYLKLVGSSFSDVKVGKCLVG